MSYNVLNFPLGDMPGREDTLELILHHYQPDLLLLQELKAQYGLTVATASMNALGGDVYASGTFVTSQSEANGGLQQNIIYNTRIFGMAAEEVIATPVRDVNYFKLYLKEDGLNAESDTTYLHIYVTHLKASSGSDNQALRLASVQDFQPHLNSLESDDMVIFGGDLNVYSSSEPAYQALLNSMNSPQLFDPIDSPGNWTSGSYPNKEVHTQSTRTSQVFGDGSSGGVDDRFDFMLCSDALLDGSGDLYYVEDSYESYGNSGQCYNSTIFSCGSSNGLPEAITSALYYCSDHFPVVMELETTFNVGVTEEVNMMFEVFSGGTPGSFRLSCSETINSLIVFDISGRELKRISRNFGPGSHNVQLDLPSGFYLIKPENNELRAKAIFIQ